MTTIRDIFHAFANEYLARDPNLPISHHKALNAILNCRTGHYGHSLYQCQGCGGQHRVHHSCGNRHCPQCQHHKTQQWLYYHLDKQLPRPHFLITFTVPETLRPFIRSHQRTAYQAMFNASATALKRLAKDERFIGTDLPGFTGVLHTWGRQLQYHPHIHYIVPGGGLSKDRTAWRPSRTNFFVPVKALSPIYRAVFKQEMANAGLLERIAPQVWTIPWNVHSQANPNGHTSFKYLAPYVFKVAISNSRIISLKDRTVTFSYRKPGSARARTTNLDAIEFIRRFLQHVLPDGFMKVRHCGFLNPRCAIPTDTIRLMLLKRDPIAFKTANIANPTPFLASCPTCGKPRVANYNTPIQTTVSYPIIGLTGLLNLVAVVDKFRPQAVAEKGSVCRPVSSPPAHRAQRAHPVVDAAARPESPTPPVAAQPAAGAPAKRRRRAGGGQ